MYLLWRIGKLPAQEELWGFIKDELVLPHCPSGPEWERMRELMRQYHDLPMDFADASLVAAAEELNEHEIFTLDSHFRIYRIHGADHFTVVP
jgi:predicted nucleic acid-binding protein